VRDALLGLVAQHWRYSYELHDAFEAVAGGEQNWDVKPAQVCAALARLENKGLTAQESLEQDGSPEKRIFAITSAMGRNCATGSARRSGQGTSATSSTSS
jgi:DNA-binding PadR family transcriptional regulator